MKIKKSVTFIVTALNEEKNVIPCLTELKNFLSTKFETFNIFFVDDDSSDKTYDLAQTITFPELKIFKNEINLGAGGSIKKVLPLVNTDFFCWFPSDMEFHPSVFSSAFSFFDHNDIVVTYTDNSKKVRTKFRYYLSNIFTNLLNTIFSQKINYYNGTTFYNAHKFKQLNIYSNRFFFHAELLLRSLAYNPKIKQVNVSLSPRLHGKSSAIKIKTFADVGMCFLNCLWELKIKKNLTKESL